jgi:uncharacterized protein (TIGR00255 family)
MLRSMTGFGRAHGAVGSQAVDVTLRSVNHRYLEISVRSPESMWELDHEVRATVSRRLHRGKVDIVIRSRDETPSAQAVRINESAARELGLAAERISQELGVGLGVDAVRLLSLPGVVELHSEEPALDEDAKATILGLVDVALVDLLEVRSAEGAALIREVTTRLDLIQAGSKRIDSGSGAAVEQLLESYRARVAELASTAGIEIDQDRLAQETVLMVEKGDIQEELARIDSHLHQMRALVEAKEGPMGKKLDFFCQELIREVNTIGSKVRSSTLRSSVVELKSEIERVREQVQNVE